ncbi:peptide-methionine (S)-S-oxide reductase MsrA [Candidatus Saccharibacteria bacterium]|nr:peptide-methionine (S)-S-oxide reductase MsrA [Candidatus Saccharibacteria bacterium]
MAKTDTIVLGGGCFWCLEASYQLIKGVESVVPGYAGGHTSKPDYYSVGTKTTGHAEVVNIEFNPDIISLSELLEIFWIIHDPTSLNKQGNDTGPQYRSIILFNNEAQKTTTDKSITEVSNLFNKPIVTEVKQLETFYEAEPEHHDYFNKHPDQAYCQVIINPKLKKLRKHFESKLK